MAKVDLRKTVYNKDQFERVTGGRGFNTFTLDGDGVTFTVDDFFNEYDNLFLSIPIFGDSNSHEFLVKRSSELVGFQRTNEDIQPLLDEIASLRDQLLQARQENINLQIEAAGGSTASSLNDQFNDLLNALGEPPEIDLDLNLEGLEGLGDALSDLASGLDGDGNGEDTEVELLEARSDLVRTTIAKDGSITPGSVDVLANDINPTGTKLELVSISTAPKKGKTEILTGGVIQYTPLLKATISDRFEYIVKDQTGQTATGVVNVEIINNKFTPPGQRDVNLPDPPPPGASLNSLTVGGPTTEDDRIGGENFDPSGPTTGVTPD